MALPAGALRGRLVALALVVASSSCSASEARPAELAVEDGGPLHAMGPCGPPPTAVPGRVAGLLLPDRAVVTAVERRSPLVTVRGYVELTPVQVRMYYQSIRDQLEVSELEDEVLEAETLFRRGPHRSWVKAQAVCATGSELTAVVGPASGSGVPTPTG